MNDSVQPASSASSDAPVVAPEVAAIGSKDGVGSGDHDEPFGGHRPYHFPTRVMLRLLLLRGEVLDGRCGLGRFADDVSAS